MKAAEKAAEKTAEKTAGRVGVKVAEKAAEKTAVRASEKIAAETAGKVATEATITGAGRLATNIGRIAKVAGTALTVGFSAFDFYSGMQDVERITGVSKKELDESKGLREKWREMQAGGSEMLSGVAFGIWDPKDIYEKADKVATESGQFWGKLWNNMFGNVKKWIS